MSLTTDTLLFSIVLMLAAIQTALPITGDGRTFLLAGLGIAGFALLGSFIMTVIDMGSKATDGEDLEN